MTPTDPLVDDQVGSRVEERRRERGLTLRQLAELTDLSAAYISRVEKGLRTPTVAALYTIGIVLGVSALELARGVRSECPMCGRPSKAKLGYDWLIAEYPKASLKEISWDSTWLLVTLNRGRRFAILQTTGAVYRMIDGVEVPDDPVWAP